MCTDARLVPTVDLPVCTTMLALFRLAVLRNLRGPLDEGRDTNCALFRYTGAWFKLYTVPGEHWRRCWLLVLLCDSFDGSRPNKKHVTTSSFDVRSFLLG